MRNRNWSAFVDAHSRNETNAEIAKRLGIAPSNITRWRTGASNPDPQKAVDFANAYSVSPLAALIASGYLNPDSLDQALIAPADLSEINTDRLLDEVQRRLAELRDQFYLLGDSPDRKALESLTIALLNRHTSPNVGGSEQDANVQSLADHKASKIEIGYDPDDAQLIEESLADRYAALEAEDPEAEQIAPDTP